MKKILALAAVAALTAGVSAYAANPFSDVTADDWAYQAVSDLSAQGVVEGYPDGTFKGEKNMTRYELAQIVARLMAKEDQLNAEPQAATFTGPATLVCVIRIKATTALLGMAVSVSMLKDRLTKTPLSTLVS